MEEKYMNVIRLKEDKFREALRLSEYAFQYKVDEDRLQQQLTRMKESHEVYGIMEGNDLAAKLHLIPFDIQYRCYIHLLLHFTVNMAGNFVRIFLYVI